MSIQLYLNNGDNFTVASLEVMPRDRGPSMNAEAWGLCPGSDVVNWINGQEYIDSDWEPHSTGEHPYGWFGALTSRDTKANHQYYVDKVNNNGAFIWGDIHNGGLYISKWGSNTYQCALFAGYLEDNTDPNYDKYAILSTNMSIALTWEQIEQISVIKLGEFNEQQGTAVFSDYPYMMIFGGNNVENGHCVTYQSTVYQTYANEYHYGFSGVTIPASDGWQVIPGYISVDPILPQYPTYQVPDDLYFFYVGNINPNLFNYKLSNQYGAPTTASASGFNGMGDWAGGSGNLVKEDPNNGSNNSTGGGYGIPSKQSDRSGDTGEHQFDTDGTDVGCFTIFNPSISELAAFESWLFQSLFDAGLESIWNNLKKMYADPSEYIIGCGLIKYHPDKEKSASTEIKFANTGTGVFARTVKQWTEITWDPMKVNEQFKSFLDYQGFSTVKIYLPFCGTYDLDQNDIMDSTLNLKYNIDNLTGACVAVLDITRNDRGNADDSNINSKIYRFNGNCMQQLPITAKDYTNSLSAVNGLCASVVTGIGSAATGNIPGMIGSVAGAVSAATNMSPTPIQSGKISDAYGMLDCLVPFLILHRPIRSLPDEYGAHHGYPASRFVKLGTCKGYTKIRTGTAWLDFIPCTDEEQQEIINYLENGIMMNDGGN